MVTVFTNPACQPCRATKRWLSTHDIPFTEKDMSTDSEARETAISLGYVQAPVVLLENGESWSGYSISKLSELL